MLLTKRQLLAHSNEEFVKAYNAGPYTSYKQIQLLLKIAGKSIRDLIADPKGTFKDLTYETILDHFDTEGHEETAIWTVDAGRCTATSMRVANRLAFNHRGGNYDFEAYHVPRGDGGHRFVRCAFSGIIIDLVSNIGAFVLLDNETVTVTTTSTISWRHDRGKIFLTDENGIEHECERVSDERALALCHYEVAHSGQLVVLFRDLNLQLTNQNISGNTYKRAMSTHGFIKWHLRPDRTENNVTVAGIKELRLRPDIDEPGNMTRIAWSQHHSAGDKVEAAKEVQRFLAAHSGPFGDQQWEADDANEFFRSIWWELCHNYGNPKVMELATTN